MQKHSSFKSTFIIFFAIFWGIIAGLCSPEYAFGTLPLFRLYGLIGQLFLNALICLVVPLIIASLICSAASLGKGTNIGWVGRRALISFFFISLLASFIGLCCVRFSPFIQVGNAPQLQTTFLTEPAPFDIFEQMLLKVIPSNVIQAASSGQILGLIGFCLGFGVFAGRRSSQENLVVLRFFQEISSIMMEMTKYVLKGLPLGVFGLVAQSVGKMGLEGIVSALGFFLTISLGLLIFAGGCLPLLLKGVAKMAPFSFFASLSPALVIAFSTSSSVAALPALMECLKEKTKLPPEIFGLTIPLGSTMSLSGTALHIAGAVAFIANYSHFPLDFIWSFAFILLATLFSMGIAGIPSAGLVSMIVILDTLGLPKEGLGVVLVAERGLDMLRTAVNVCGNITCSALVSSSQLSKEALEK